MHLLYISVLTLVACYLVVVWTFNTTYSPLDKIFSVFFMLAGGLFLALTVVLTFS